MKYILLAAALFLTGCTNVPTRYGVANIQRNVFYFKDSRTSLCFAGLVSSVEGGKIASISNVPCSDLVNQNLLNLEDSDSVVRTY